MKYLTIRSQAIAIIILLTPVLSQAQPAGPGDGSDPFATPVNGGVAFVSAIAFLYGVYRIYQVAKTTPKTPTGKITKQIQSLNRSNLTEAASY